MLLAIDVIKELKNNNDITSISKFAFESLISNLSIGFLMEDWLRSNKIEEPK